MIEDEFQYDFSREWVEKFKKSIAAMERDEEEKHNHFLKWDAGRTALQYHVDKLEREMAEYERLIDCDRSQPIEILIENLHKLPDALIKARIAAKMSQKELADLLEIDEDRIKECEDKNYQCASFSEILDISFALGLEFKTAVMQVDFEQIEDGKKSAEKWRDQKVNRERKIS